MSRAARPAGDAKDASHKEGTARSGPRARWSSADLVPLADRLRCMEIFRAGAVAAVILFGVTAQGLQRPDLPQLALWTSVYAVLALISGFGWRVIQRRDRPLFGAMLIVDGAYLAWVAYSTGGMSSPLRLLALVHILTVAMLASYRTGLKTAFWHSVLLVALADAQDGGIIPRPAGDRAFGIDPTFQVAVFIVAFWAVAIATASFAAVNERELRRRRYDLEALARLAASLETVSDPVAVAEVLLANIADAFGISRGLVVGAQSGDFVLMATVGSQGGSAHVPKAETSSVLHRVRESKQPLLASSVQADADPWMSTVLPGARNLMVLPLTTEGRCTGALILEHAAQTRPRVEQRVVSMLERFAAYAALALQNAWLVERIRASAATDGLTGIANRATFDTVLKKELARGTRSSQPVSLVMLDLDNFKQLNDTHGHLVGDQVLREVAQVLSAHCRQLDTAARFGGEEFALILPGCDRSDAVVIAERLRVAIERDVLTPITVSAGVASYPGHAKECDALVAAADAALYRAKHAGRNRVTWATRRRGMRVGGLTKATRKRVQTARPALARSRTPE